MSGGPLRILVIQSWVVPVDRIRACLVAAGFAPHIVRVDFEAALDAALWRRDFDLILVARATPSLPMSVVESRIREHGIAALIIELGDLELLPDEVRRVLAARRN